MLKLIEWRWGLRPLTCRDESANNLAEVLDFAHPELSFAPIPIVRGPFGTPCRPTMVRGAGGSFSIVWNMPGTKLQCAPTVLGPWRDVPGASSPFPVSLVGAAAFYRLVPITP